ncbi:MAG: MerR family transcriptional regulator [Cyanobacteriota bacterium]|nr:MerR family transcriptional regulator [Cyanobacteriota bacterium]
MAHPPSDPVSATPGLRIGDVARLTGLSVKTIRFYCDQGLVRPFGRSAGGYRLFNDDSLAELAIIRALRGLDVSLDELAPIMEVRRAGICNCESLKNSISAKMASIDERILALEVMKKELAHLLACWQACGGAQQG